MEDQTRQLLSLLADGVAGSIIEALEEGPLEEGALRSQVGGSRQTINRRLEDLQGWGVVAFDVPRAGKPSRPGRQWRLQDRRVLRLANAADSLVLDLLEERAQAQREGIAKRRRRAVRQVRGSNG